MKNIHILPTDKPSRLSKQLDNPLVLYKQFIENRKFGRWSINQNIYITNDEEIKEGDCFIGIKVEEDSDDNSFVIVTPKNKQQYKGSGTFVWVKKIILTTDQDLIDVQAIDDDFLEWFVKNPSCEEVEVERDSREVGGHNGGVQIEYGYYEIIIAKEEPKQETLEEAAEKSFKYIDYKNTFIAGAKWQQERSYSQLDVVRILSKYEILSNENFNEWFEQFKNRIR